MASFKKEPILFVNCDGEFNETKAGPCVGSNPSQCLLFVCSVNSEIHLTIKNKHSFKCSSTLCECGEHSLGNNPWAKLPKGGRAELDLLKNFGIDSSNGDRAKRLELYMKRVHSHTVSLKKKFGSRARIVFLNDLNKKGNAILKSLGLQQPWDDSLGSNARGESRLFNVQAASMQRSMNTKAMKRSMKT